MTYHNTNSILTAVNKLTQPSVTESTYIEASQLFAKRLSLPAAKLFLLKDKMQLHDCSPGTILLEESSVDSSIVLLLHGSVIVSMKNNNTEITVYSLGVGEMTGSLSVLTGEPNLFSVKARTPSRVAVLSKEYFYEYVFTCLQSPFRYHGIN